MNKICKENDFGMLLKSSLLRNSTVVWFNHLNEIKFWESKEDREDSKYKILAVELY